MPSAQRYTHIDIAKGMSILLVVFFHSTLAPYIGPLSDSLSAVRVPFFIFLAGIFLRVQVPFSAYMTKKFHQLLKPLYVTILGCFIYKALFMGKMDFWLLFGGLYGSGYMMDMFIPCWFLTHLFLLFIISYPVLKYAKKYIKPFYLLSLLISGILISQIITAAEFQFDQSLFVDIRLPFHLEIAPITLGYFLSGYYFSEAVKKLSFSWAKFLPLLTIFLLISYAHYVGWIVVKIDLNRVDYSSFYALFASISGIAMLLLLAKRIERTDLARRFFLFYGRSSLFILIFHFYATYWIWTAFPYLFTYRKELAPALILYFGTITLPVFIKYAFSQVPLLRRLYNL